MGLTVEEQVWIALAEPRTSEQVYKYVNKHSRELVEWETIEIALAYWISTGLVRVTDKRFWRSMNIHKKDTNV